MGQAVLTQGEWTQWQDRFGSRTTRAPAQSLLGVTSLMQHCRNGSSDTNNKAGDRTVGGGHGGLRPPHCSCPPTPQTRGWTRVAGLG